MKDKIKQDNYIKIALIVFTVICASIVVYFTILRLDFFIGIVVKIFNTLLPIILGILFAYLLNPVVSKLENNLFNKLGNKIYPNDIKKSKNISRILSILVTYLITLIILGLIIGFGIPSLIESIQIMLNNLPSYLNNVYVYLAKFVKSSPELYNMLQTFNTNIINYITNSISPSIDTLMTNITLGITSIIKIIFNCFVGIVASIYLIYDKERFITGFKNVLDAFLPDNIHENINELLTYIDKIFGGFMIAKIIDSAIIGVITFIFMIIFKLPYALIISVIVGVTNIIPYFGPFIGAIPSFILLLLVNPKKSITFLILIILIQQFDGNILGPKLIGNKTGIKSFWVLFSILLFGGLFGFVGMIFGVPVFAVIYSLTKSYINKKLASKKS